MNENENNFESLRRLLALKRHETPPPGYFNRFSGLVVARIRAGEGRSGAEGYFSEAPWLLKLLRAFEFKPAFAGAFASAVCLLLVFVGVYEDGGESAPQAFLQNSQPSTGSFAAMTPAILPQSDSIGMIASNNAANSLQPVASLFAGSPNQFAQPVSFTLPGN